MYVEAGAEKKINQKINKTLKLLQSTEQDPAESSSSFAEKDSLLLRLIGGDFECLAGKAHLRRAPAYFSRRANGTEYYRFLV